MLVAAVAYAFLKMSLLPKLPLPAFLPMLACLPLIFLFRHGANIRFSGNGLVLVFFALLSVSLLKRGGIYSSQLLWLGALPLLAFVINSRLSGLIWLLLVQGLALYYYVLENSSAISYVHQLPLDRPGHYYWNWALIFAFNSLLFYIYARDKSRIVSQLKEKEQLLIHQKDELTEQAEARKINEIELRQLNENLEQFAYAVSHDLKEPLRMIKMYTQLLKRNLGDQLSANNEEFMEYVMDGTDRMHRLLDDLLQYSRLNNYDQGVKEVNLNDMLLIVKNNLAFSIQNKEAQINIPRPLPSITGNPTFLVQLFQNLLSNAIKFHHPDRAPIINITFQKTGMAHYISIRDNGIGIPEEYQSKIFDIFTKLHTRQEYEGSGIGLATCKKIVAAMGGGIHLQSTPGEGTSFTISIPIDQPDGEFDEKKLLAQMYN
ncbi:MAG: ATP-binding protein [Bacteroidota bacterium]